MTSDFVKTLYAESMQHLRLCQTQEANPQIMEHWLCTMQAHKKSMEFLLFEQEGKIFIHCSEDLSAHYPGSRSLKVDRPQKVPKFYVSQKKGPLLPIKRHSQFEDRVNKFRIFPMDTLLQEMVQKPGSFVSFQFSNVPETARHRALKRAKKKHFHPERKLEQWECKTWFHFGWRKCWVPLLRHALASVEKRPQILEEQMESLHEREDPQRAVLDKLSRPLFRVQVQMSHPFEPFIQGFNLPYLGVLKVVKNKPRDLIFSAEELATLMSPAQADKSANRLDSEPSAYLPGPEQPLKMDSSDRLRHLYFMGKTGMGKSTAMLHFLKEDFALNRNILLLDPHGDLVEDALKLLPKGRQADLILLEPWQLDHPLALNPLDCSEEKSPHLRSSALVEMFQVLAKGSWGPRLEYVLRNLMLTLCMASNTTLLDLPRFLTQKEWAQNILSQIQDTELKRFWEEEFFCLDKHRRDEVAAPILNKVGPLITSPLLRNIFGQARSKFQMEPLLEEGKIILISLAKGQLGEDISRLLGMIFISLTYEALLKRSLLPLQERSFLALYLDEFQNFATPTLLSMLSECRKYGLALCMANQYLTQIPLEIQDALLGNMGSFLIFRTSQQDAEKLSPTLGLNPEDLTQLAPFQAYAKFLKQNQPLPSFRMELEAHKPIQSEQEDALRWESANRFGRPRLRIEKRLENRYNKSKKNPRHEKILVHAPAHELSHVHERSAGLG